MKMEKALQIAFVVISISTILFVAWDFITTEIYIANIARKAREKISNESNVSLDSWRQEIMDIVDKTFDTIIEIKKTKWEIEDREKGAGNK